MIVDAHHHLWDPARGDYAWLQPGSPLDRAFDAAELAPQLAAAGVDGTILVQAAPTLAETDWLLAIAARTPWVLGVVGWVDLDAPDAAAQLAARPRLVGIRPMLQDLADPRWILAPERHAGLVAITEAGVAFDALVRPAGLAAIVELADRHPDLVIVLDHLAKPPVGDGGAMAAWRGDLARAADRSNLRCKLSGVLTECPPGVAEEALASIAADALGFWGGERLIWGSDWPVLTLASDYRHWFDRARALTANLTEKEQAAVFGLNAIATYRLRAPEQAA